MNRNQFLIILLQTTSETILISGLLFKFTHKLDGTVTCNFTFENLDVTATISNHHINFTIETLDDITLYLTLKQFLANYPTTYLHLKKAISKFDLTLLLLELDDQQLSITIDQIEFEFTPVLTLLYKDLYICRFSNDILNFRAVIRYRLFNSAISKITVSNIGLYNPFDQLTSSLFELLYELLYFKLTKAILLFQSITSKG